MKKRRGTSYFERIDGAPDPVAVSVKRRVTFSEVDAMAIVWHGRYALYFEDGSAELGRRCGLSYRDFYDAGLRAPIVTCHIEYFRPLQLDEEFTITAALIWDDGARLNTEYALYKEDGSLATSGYTVQVLTNYKTGEVCIVSPKLLETCRRRWRAGEFS